MYGKVTKYFHDRGYGFIRGEDGNSYFIHTSKLYGEYLDRGYHVFFMPYKDDRSDYNAKNVSVIYTPDKEVKEKLNTHKNKNSRKHKSCNADKVIRNDERFQRFVKKFMYEQRKLNKVKE